MNSKSILAEQHITQHKRFVPYGTHPNFCFAKTSFMLGTLSEIAVLNGRAKILKFKIVYLNYRVNKL